MADLVIFYTLAALAVTASLLVVAQRNPIYSVMLLIASFGALAGLYVTLDAPFLAVVQIIIYTGAIMVLFLFVVMLLNAPKEGPAPRRVALAAGPRRLGAGLAALLGLELLWALFRMGNLGAPGDSAPAAGISSVQRIGQVLYTDYAFPFEVTSILIIVAMVGAVVLAKRQV